MKPAVSSHEPRGRRRARAGYTLTEVVLAIGLSLALVGVMMWFYQFTGEARQKAIDDVSKVHMRRQIMDRLTRQLRNALTLQVGNVGIIGETDQLSFTTAVLPGMAAWVVRTATEDPIPPEQDLTLVTIQLRVVEDENGDQTIAGLEQRTQKILATETVEDGRDITSVLLSPYYRFVRFRYWDDTNKDWLDRLEQTQLPKAIEIALGERPLPAGDEPIDYPYELHTRVLYLPGANAPTAAGALMQQGGGAAGAAQDAAQGAGGQIP